MMPQPVAQNSAGGQSVQSALASQIVNGSSSMYQMAQGNGSTGSQQHPQSLHQPHNMSNFKFQNYAIPQHSDKLGGSSMQPKG
jgi:hypothetical protein